MSQFHPCFAQGEMQQEPVTTLPHSEEWRHANCRHTGVRIQKRSWSPGIDSKEWIPPAYVAWRAGTTTVFPTRFPAPIDCLKIPAPTDKREKKIFLI